jgi:methylenetetrahydrofolate dehydrogenase (NADP+) / methenyltetrahydrofolate cyclohydrolase
VGKPAALLLLRENATVTICHSQTRDLAGVLRSADIVVVAVGKPGLITGSMLKRGSVVVDVGINVVDGKIVGDVEAATASEVCAALTPVPGGVGPVTNALLMTHLLRAADAQARRDANPHRRRSRDQRTMAPIRPVAISGSPAGSSDGAAAAGRR